ncbi:MAG TPA: zf-HC2 domain-containing protein [Terriglobales bacterium]|nr:zf-HC2 domain-containing protein [Terriglobales bacterium]
MVVTCEQVWHEISNYLDGEIVSDLRAAMDEHLRGCQKCSAVLDGTRNVMGLYGEDSMFEPPQGFSQRLHKRLEQNMPRQRGTAFGWMIAVAAALLIVGSFELSHSSAFVGPQQRSQQAQPGTGVPPEMMVVVAEDGKLFHAGAACPLIHDKAHLRKMTASQARREGYTPCVQCMKKYLNENAGLDADDDDGGEVASSGARHSR